MGVSGSSADTPGPRDPNPFTTGAAHESSCPSGGRASTRTRVLVAGDHRMLREAFVRLLEPACDVAEAEADARVLLASAHEFRPDVIVLDLAIPLLHGLDAARQLRCEMPAVQVIFLAMKEDPAVAAEAFRAGAAGYLLMNSAASELLTAVREVSEGRSYVTPLMTRGLIGNLLRPPRAPDKTAELSPRRREVLQLLAEGHTMKEIARVLTITPRTVAFHKYGMMEQFGITSNAELVQFAIKEGVITLSTAQPQPAYA